MACEIDGWIRGISMMSFARLTHSKQGSASTWRVERGGREGVAVNQRRYVLARGESVKSRVCEAWVELGRRGRFEVERRKALRVF